MEKVTGKDLITTAVLPRFFITLLVTCVGMVLSALFLPPGVSLALGAIPLVVLIGLLLKALFTKNKGKRKGVTSYGMMFPMWLVYLFTLLMGIGIYPVIAIYIDEMGMALVVASFGITAVLFGSLFVYTYVTRKDYTFLGGMLFFSLIALILVSLVGIIVQSSILNLVIAFAGILIFSGYILYDISRMKSDDFTREDVPSAVFDLYLNFVNIFLHILRIVNEIFE